MSLQILGVSVIPEEIINIATQNIRGARTFLICVNFHPPKGDLVFVFRSREDRDREFDNIQIQCDALREQQDAIKTREGSGK